MRTFFKIVIIALIFMSFNDCMGSSNASEKRKSEDDYYIPQVKRSKNNNVWSAKTVEEKVVSLFSHIIANLDSDFDIDAVYEEATRQWTDPDRLVMVDVRRRENIDGSPCKIKRVVSFDWDIPGENEPGILTPPVRRSGVERY